MAAFFGAQTRSRAALNDDQIAELLANGNDSEIEEFADEEEDIMPNILHYLEESESGSENEDVVLSIPTTSSDRSGRGRGSRGISKGAIRGRGLVKARGQTRGQVRGQAREQARGQARVQAGGQARVQARGQVRGQARGQTRGQARGQARGGGRGWTNRVWVETEYPTKPHDYNPLPAHPVRLPVDYYRDYFDDSFLDEVARCTNLYHMRHTGIELKTTRLEIAELFSLHLIIGCIPYPRLPMYWKTGMNLALVSDTMTRDRFLTLRKALHVVDSDTPSEGQKDNCLWKVQPIINKVKETCNRLERVPGYYSIDEQMIPFTSRCPLRQVVKNKPRPVGLKNFVLTTSEGLMLDFAIYQGAKTTFGDTALGLGPSVILHLSQSVPPGSCVYHDRYFTTVLLAEEMLKRNLHSTGTIMQNRIPDRATINFKSDKQMARGESQQFVSNDIAIVKWKDNKSVLMASNCTGIGEIANVKRWDKNTKTYVNISAPTVIERYNKNMGGVDVLDQQIEYYRAFIKTRKWPLKVIVHFLDLACVNAWRLYNNDCKANGYRRKDSLDLLQFRMQVAECLKSLPEVERRHEEPEPAPEVRRNPLKIYKPTSLPPLAKRHDGYDHLPVFDDIKAPRTCRMEDCGSRSKIKCEKCNVYLCLSRDKNCFRDFHKKA